MICYISGIPVSFFEGFEALCSLIDNLVFKVMTTNKSWVLIPGEGRFLVADGSAMTSYGQEKVECRIECEEYDLCVVVVDLGCWSTILWFDFLEEQSIVIKMESGTLSINKELVIMYREQAQPGFNEVWIDESLAIYPLAWA